MTVCAFACALSLALVAQGQPLAEGAQIEQSKFFVEGKHLKRISPENKISTESVDLQSEFRIVQPPAWSNKAMLLIGDSEAILAGPTTKDIELQVPATKDSDSEEESKIKLQSIVWGEFVALHFPGTQIVQLIKADGSAEQLETQSPIKSFHSLDQDNLLILTEQGQFYLYRPETLNAPDSHQHFLGKSAEALVSGRSALIWSKESRKVSVVNNQKVVERTLPEEPSRGVEALSDDEFLLLTAHYMAYLNRHSVLKTLDSPSVLTDENRDLARFFTDNNQLHFLFPNPKHGLTSMRFTNDGKTSGGLLGDEKIKALILPTKGQSHRPFLLTETSFDEDKVNFNNVIYNGQAVVNPKTHERGKHTVHGHVLYMLTSQGSWTTVTSEPRNRVIGAANVVEGNLIYPTQTEPANTVGVKLEVNWEFPHSRVVFQAYNANSGLPAWTLESPRGEAPSPARIPQETWPTLSPHGPILYTTEDNRLTGLDPSDGTVKWTSSALSMDESRPRMLKWNDNLGLVATNNTTKKFYLLNDSGMILANSTLNEIFNSQRKYNLAGVIVICLALLIYIYVAGKKKLFIRKIAGLEALDEAVGRATEMGKPVLYVTGLADVDDIQTLAALSILSHVSKKTAEYDSSIVATTSRAVTFSAAQEVVRDAFTWAGRPDSFSLESVQYISDDQFGYAAGVDGLMLREEPAANFYMGKFYAESLIFAETGHATGAIQIAGTAQANQLPFFVAACDYTLIGEELFAASAYLSGDPLQVGSLRGQDVGKAIVMIFLVLASIYVTFTELGG